MEDNTTKDYLSKHYINGGSRFHGGASIKFYLLVLVCGPNELRTFNLQVFLSLEQQKPPTVFSHYFSIPSTLTKKVLQLTILDSSSEIIRATNMLSINKYLRDSASTHQF